MVPEKRNFHVLIVDDQIGPRQGLKLVLSTEIQVDDKAYGVSCESASNGVEALALLDKKEFGLVISDIRMPREKHGALPVILITGYGSYETAQEAIRLGATDYVGKPWLVEYIRNRVANVIRNSAAGSGAAVSPGSEETRVQLQSRRPADREIYPYVVGGLLHDSLNTLWAATTGLESIERKGKQRGMDEDLVHKIKRSEANMRHLEAVLKLIQTISREYYAPVREPSEDLATRANALVEHYKQTNPEVNYTLELAHDAGEAELPLPIVIFIVGELLQNATKACADGEESTVTVSLDGKTGLRELTVACRDSGPGFPVHLLERAEQGAFRPDRKNVTGGYGLYLINEIVTRLEGRLRLQNSVSGGAEVEVTLPLETSGS